MPEPIENIAQYTTPPNPYQNIGGMNAPGYQQNDLTKPFDLKTALDNDPQFDVLGSDVYNDLPPFLQAVKDKIANGRSNKGRTSYFLGENKFKTTEQIAQEQAQQNQGGTFTPTDNTKIDLSEYDKYNAELERMKGEYPQMPDRPELKNPSSQQLLFAGVATLLDFWGGGSPAATAAVPYQYQLQKQQQDFADMTNKYLAMVDEYKVKFNTTSEQAMRALNASLQKYQIETGNERMNNELSFREYAMKAGFEQDKTMFGIRARHDFDMLGEQAKENRLSWMIQTYFNDGTDPKTRDILKTTLEMFGVKDLPKLEGMTQANRLQKAQADMTEQQALEQTTLWPLKKEEADIRMKWLREDDKWYDKMKSLEYKTGVANLNSIREQIKNMQFSRNFQVDEQQRMYFSELYDSAKLSIGAVQGQLGSMYAERKELLDSVEKARAYGEESAEYKGAKDMLDQWDSTNSETISGLRGELTNLTGELDSYREYLKAASGIQVGSTDLGGMYVGTPYSWGGGGKYGPTKGTEKGKDTIGFDCSGLTQCVAFNDFGVDIPRSAMQQFKMDGFDVPTNPASGLLDLKAGDFVYFKDPKKESWHVAIHIGNGMIRHAPNTGETIRDENIDKFLKNTSKVFMGAKRFWNPGQFGWEPPMVPSIMIPPGTKIEGQPAERGDSGQIGPKNQGTFDPFNVNKNKGNASDLYKPKPLFPPTNGSGLFGQTERLTFDEWLKKRKESGR